MVSRTFFKKGIAVFMSFALILSGVTFASIGSTKQAYAAEDYSTPVIQGTDVSQAYAIENYAKTRTFEKYISGKWKPFTLSFGNRNYVTWHDSNLVTVKFHNSYSGSMNVNYVVEKTTNPAIGFTQDSNVSLANLGNGNYSIKFGVERGIACYCRIVAQYNGYDSTNKYINVNKASNIAFFRTTPKTFAASKLQIKKSKKWISKEATKVKSWKKKKSKKKYTYGHTYRISWYPRSDVDGYYVYKAGFKQVRICKPTSKSIKPVKLKNWQYYLSSDLVSYNGYLAGVSAKKYCKKVKTLKASATSYTFDMVDEQDPVFGIEKDRFCDSHTEYMIVPYIIQNGKIYVGDADSYYLNYGVYYPNSLKSFAKKKGFYAVTNRSTKEMPFFGTNYNSNDWWKW